MNSWNSQRKGSQGRDTVGKSLLLISKRDDVAAFAAEVAVAAGLSLSQADTPKAGAQIIADSKENSLIIFVDASTENEYQEFETAIQETVGLFSDKINANAIHFISSEDLERVEYLIKSPIFGHFLLRI